MLWKKKVLNLNDPVSLWHSFSPGDRAGDQVIVNLRKRNKCKAPPLDESAKTKMTEHDKQLKNFLDSMSTIVQDTSKAIKKSCEKEDVELKVKVTLKIMYQ